MNIDIERLKVDPGYWDECGAGDYRYAFTTGPDWDGAKDLIGEVEFAGMDGNKKDGGGQWLNVDACSWVPFAVKPDIIPRPEPRKVEWDGEGLPPVDFLRSKFDYDPATGLLSRKHDGKVLGYAVSKRDKLYTKVYCSGKAYYAHRLIWAIIYGSWPDGEIDHINGDSEDNCLANLRIVSRKENCQNQKTQGRSRSGYCGVNWHDITGKWRARVKVDGIEHYVGLFDCPEEAATAIREKRDSLGFHENHGIKLGEDQ